MNAEFFALAFVAALNPKLLALDLLLAQNRLALYLPRQPLWLLGVAAAVGSFVFQALALHNGPMSVVQPLLITELIFALVLRRVWIHQEVAGPRGPRSASSA